MIKITSAKQSVGYTFTLNNPTREEIKFLREMKDRLWLGYPCPIIYIGYGFEHFFEEEKTPHIQGMLMLKDPVSFKQLKAKYSLFERFHFEEIRTTPNEARTYCRKEGFFDEVIHRTFDGKMGILTDHWIEYKIAKEQWKLKEAKRIVEQARIKEARNQAVLRDTVADADSCASCAVSQAFAATERPREYNISELAEIEQEMYDHLEEL